MPAQMRGLRPGMLPPNLQKTAMQNNANLYVLPPPSLSI